MIYTDDSLVQEKINRLIEMGQEHILQFWPQLDDEGRRTLLKEIEDLNLQDVQELIGLQQKNHSAGPEIVKLEPTRALSLDERAGLDGEMRPVGEQALKLGQVGAFLVAGGQGSRLGFDGPKGMFPITPVRHKSFFQLFAEKIRRLQGKYLTTIPWYIMTSQSNHHATKTFFKQNDYFGLQPANVWFFMQDMLPALDENGRLIMAAKDRLFHNPNGHGGSLQALYKNNALKDMQQRGIRYLFYFQVDNVLLRMCDPVFLGYHITQKAQMSTKVIRKSGPEEKMGVLCKINGIEGVIEYSDLSDQDTYATTPGGALRFWAGNTAIHMFNVDFLLKHAAAHLPYHRAIKSIPQLDASGMPVMANGVKFESFIFDLLLYAQKSFSLEVDRSLEFSAVKNKEGKDSPQTARQDLNRYYARMCAAAGIHLDTNGDSPLLEISPLLAEHAEDLAAQRKQLQLTGQQIYLGDD